MPGELKYPCITILILTTLIQLSVLEESFCRICVLNEDCARNQCCYTEEGHTSPFPGHCVMGGTEEFPCSLGTAPSPFCKCHYGLNCTKVQGDAKFGKCEKIPGKQIY